MESLIVVNYKNKFSIGIGNKKEEQKTEELIKTIISHTKDNNIEEIAIISSTYDYCCNNAEIISKSLGVGFTKYTVLNSITHDHHNDSDHHHSHHDELELKLDKVIEIIDSYAEKIKILVVLTCGEIGKHLPKFIGEKKLGTDIPLEHTSSWSAQIVYFCRQPLCTSS